ncbi:hypothetical protein D9757_012359 [Collybiopsis confluens]|uniref:Transmembrane protein n=1 Tax=Collybiopsis confluens TaxID=2823264 RepID=A0A8H5G3B5_9AGAR|nr:hypothetical protein D9757_012359 [Collybiopsis confluens]
MLSKFTRFFSALCFFLAVLSLVSAASVAVAAPDQAVEKRQGSEVVSILEQLLGTLNTVKPQLVAIQQAGNATTANVSPLVKEITGALSTTAGKLGNLLNPFAGLRRRQVDISGIISEITSVIEDIVTVLKSLLTVQNIDTLVTLINDGFEIATNVLKFVAAILGLVTAAT